ncbi:hypothetical protein AB2B41_12045 [Marimonas sp. MJW-29]|uniref:Sulfotransferase family protein n=1 Tax=Sulfitobacter sediminis TaxID=3234186 RepID=A0ABV3RMZ8_9RHOB
MISFEELNERRTDAFRKSEKDEDFLFNLNASLTDLEAELQRSTPKQEANVLIFVTGLPRSGTTFTAQLIAESLEIGRITNLAARFYRAPLVGLSLSRMVLGCYPKANVKSEYALTEGASGLHEFGYFWRDQLKISKLSDLLTSKSFLSADGWERLRGLLCQMATISGGALVMKNLYGTYDAQAFQRHNIPCVFVNIQRDSRAVFSSILSARRKFFGEDLDSWWSLPCHDFEKFSHLTIEQQVARQVVGLERIFENELGSLPDNMVVHWQYERLCEDPECHIEALQDRISEKYGIMLPVRSDLQWTDFVIKRVNNVPHTRADEQLREARVLFQ